jgi:DNA-binding protein YbaB
VTEIWEAEAFLDPNSSRDYLRSWKERVDTLAARTQAMSEQLEQLRVSAKDGNDLAEVTIDSAGVLVDLKLGSRMHRFEPDVVARAVLTALAEARITAAARSREIAEATLGPDSIAARTIADRMQQSLESSVSHGGAADD